MMNKLYLLLMCLLPGFSLCAQSQLQFAGSIETGKNKTLYLEMKLRRENNQLTGTYYYTNNGGDMLLKGSLNGSDFFLEESNNKGVVTGKFQGTFKADSNLVRGHWTTADGKRSYPFSLSAEDYVDYKILRRNASYHKQIGHLSCGGEFQWFEMRNSSNPDMEKTFNHFINELRAKFYFPKDDKELPCAAITQSETIDFWEKNKYFISIEIASSNYECGAGAINSKKHLFYDLGSKSTLALDKLLKPGYQQELQKIINQIVAGRDGNANFITDEDLKEEYRGIFDHFYIEDNKLTFFFPRPGAMTNVLMMDDVGIELKSIRHLIQSGTPLDLWLREKGI